MIIINRYFPLLRGAEEEFWTEARIEHIRALALTGKPQRIFTRRSSLRILDGVRFKGERDGSRVEPLASTEASVAGIRLSAPLYLGDMSYGALSGNPNVAIARAADMTETLAGTGEGGLYPEVARSGRIFVQWASARFGVDVDVLMRGAGIVIKIGQGAKPGIGGHLPAGKVTEAIAEARRIPAGKDAISPAPHHDIYSIEDLGQRIEALKEATGKPVFVKVAATNYIPYIVSGIARMGADGVIIDGHGAGTGAAPMIIRDNVGIPIELAVAAADRALREQGMREGFTIIAAGRVADSTDAAKLMALGADLVSVGTAALIAMGCIMDRKCHLGYCPTALTCRIDGIREVDVDFALARLVNFIRGFALELSGIVHGLGLSSVEELRGNRGLLTGDGVSADALRALGIDGRPAEPSPIMGDLWNRRRLDHIKSLALKGNPTIVSMGSTAPPDVERPGRIADWIRSDGAQVTRPSIDPYREDIDTGFYLAGGSLYVSMPVMFDVIGASDGLREAISWAALASGTAVLADAAREPYAGISISLDGAGAARWSTRPEPGSYLLVPSDSVDNVDVSGLRGIPGFIVDEEPGGESVEVAVSRLDTRLRGMGVRRLFDVLAKSPGIRDAGDAFKVVGLGADSVIASYRIVELAAGETGDRQTLRRRAFSLMMGFRKELALLAGAAGVYSMQSTLTGNRELFRTVNMSPGISTALRVKPAGLP